MTIRAALVQTEQKLTEAGINSAALDALLLLELIDGRTRAELIAHDEEELSEAALQQLKELSDLRAERVPLSHITHSKQFLGINFYIDGRVLEPRPESEIMVTWASETAPINGRVIDVGTGSGAMAIALKLARPDLEVWGTDISTDALDVANRNAEAHEAEIHLVQSDLLDHVRGEYDLALANLPYLKNDAELMPEVQKEPRMALFGGRDGLAIYRRFFKQIPDLLAPGGAVITECDPWQQESLKKIAETNGFKLKREDYFALAFTKN